MGVARLPDRADRLLPQLLAFVPVLLFFCAAAAHVVADAHSAAI
jgi:hypothetical protein